MVNWDLIPQNAINQLTLVPSNPVYGLNAIGGALAFEMKNGYTYHAVEGEIIGGSYGRAVASVQAGGQTGNLSGYITADAINDAGWRNNSPSSLRRVYADLGARGDQTEFHVTFTGADNNFGAAAATPVQMLAPGLGQHLHASADDAEPACVSDRKRDLEAERHLDLSGRSPISATSAKPRRRQRHQRDERSDGLSRSHALCFPNLDGTVSNLTTTRGQTVPNAGALVSQRPGRDRPHLDRHQQFWRLGAGSDGGKDVRTQQQRHDRAEQSTAAWCNFRRQANWARSTPISSRPRRALAFSSTSRRATSRRSGWAPTRSMRASTRPTRSTSRRGYRSPPADASTSLRSI